MKESQFETVSVEKETAYIHTCNCCGKSVKVRPNSRDEWNDDIKEFYVDFGYESHHDGEKWSFDLCEECLINIVKQFKYVPYGFMEDNYTTLSREEHQKVFENWKETGQWEELMFKTYEELIELVQIYDTEYINEVIKKFHPDEPLLEVEDEIE